MGLLSYRGFWVSYYGEPKEREDANGGVYYEVTAVDCWQYVEDDTIAEGKDLWSIYDYCLYDFDNDGNLEECIIYMGYTSGLSTISFSAWDNGECEVGALMQVDHALGYAFFTDENVLSICSSEGKRYYPGLLSNGRQP